MKYKDNDIVYLTDRKGIVQFVDKNYILVYFLQTGSLEIFNTDGSSRS